MSTGDAISEIFSLLSSGGCRTDAMFGLAQSLGELAGQLGHLLHDLNPFPFLLF